MTVLDALHDAVARTRFTYNDEDELQEALAMVLRARGLDVRREVRLNSRDRIDLLVGRVGVEVKIAGKPVSVLRQLARYAESPELDELVLVTSRVRHQAPDELNGKKVTVICLAGRTL